MIPSFSLETIESTLFTASVGVVSTPRSLDEAIWAQGSVREVLAAMTDHENRRELLNRVLELIARPHDPRYCHPDDLAIAIYVRILGITDATLAVRGADAVLQHRNFWWARAASLRVIRAPNVRAGADLRKVVLGQPQVRSQYFAMSPPIPPARRLEFLQPALAADLYTRTTAGAGSAVELSTSRVAILTHTTTE